MIQTMTADPLITMIQRLDGAIASNKANSVTCAAVKSVLEDWIRPELALLPKKFLEPSENNYARRLLHRDPQGLYSVVVMVWDQGQGTPIHDHAGLWCVECVYTGLIRVDSYALDGKPDDTTVDFMKMDTINAGCGTAGSLIPPFDYHVIKNAQPTPSVTVHVYGGDMDWCNAYQPTNDGHYEKQRKDLAFTA